MHVVRVGRREIPSRRLAGTALIPAIIRSLGETLRASLRMCTEAHYRVHTRPAKWRARKNEASRILLLIMRAASFINAEIIKKAAAI